MTKTEKAEMAKEQEYIKKVRAVFKSFNGRVTGDELKAEFDRLNLPRTGKVFSSLILQAINNGLEIINTYADLEAIAQSLNSGDENVY